MKICYLAPGNSEHTIRWINSLVELNYDITLITMHDVLDSNINNNVKVIKLRYPHPHGYYLNTKQLKNILKEVGPDILHVHYASGYGTLGRNVEFSPTVLSVWGSDIFIYPKKNIINKYILKKNLKAPCIITSSSQAMLLETEKYCNNKEIHVIPFGIDLNLFSPNLKSKQNDEIVIGTVKSLKKVYGIDIMLKTISIVLKRLIDNGEDDLAAKIKVVIIGEGEERIPLMQLSEKLGIEDKVEFLGKVSNLDINSFLNTFDVFFALSRSESFGVSVLEASASGIPVITSDVGGLPEVVQDGITGFTINLDNKEILYESLIKLIRNNDLRIQMGQNGRIFVKNYFDIKYTTQKMVGIYKEIYEKRMCL